MKKYFTPACICGVAFVVLMVLLKIADVAAIGPEGTAVGLSHLNGFVRDIVTPTAPSLNGWNRFWYHLSEITGSAAFLLVLLFAALGVLELVQRKRLTKVDRELLVLAVLYVVTMLLYALFEVVIINYRPVLAPGETQIEASFPSTHTMLSIVIYGSALPLVHRYIRSDSLQKMLRTVFTVLLVLTILARILSGVHWCTDILGGLLAGVALLLFFLHFSSNRL